MLRQSAWSNTLSDSNSEKPGGRMKNGSTQMMMKKKKRKRKEKKKKLNPEKNQSQLSGH